MDRLTSRPSTNQCRILLEQQNVATELLTQTMLIQLTSWNDWTFYSSGYVEQSPRT